MRVTSKGQVTIPAGLRKKYGIEPDSEVMFEETERGPIIVACDRRTPGERLVNNLVTAGKHFAPGLSTDEYMELVRGPREPEDKALVPPPPESAREQVRQAAARMTGRSPETSASA